MTLKSKLYEAKEGITIGAVAGLIAVFVLQYIGVDLTFAVTQMSVVEQTTGIIIENKAGMIIVLLGAFIGGMLDLNKDKLPSSIRRWF